MHLKTLLVAALAATNLMFAADPAVGTWKLNLAKSKIPPAPGAPAEMTVILEDQNGQVVSTSKGKQSDGKPISQKTSFPSEGGAINFLEPAPPADLSGQVKRIDADTLEFITLRDGKEVQSSHNVLSKDRKTLTITGKAMTPQGPVEFVEVLEKQ